LVLDCFLDFFEDLRGARVYQAGSCPTVFELIFYFFGAAFDKEAGLAESRCAGKISSERDLLFETFKKFGL
jgi:hypothetical protein